MLNHDMQMRDGEVTVKGMSGESREARVTTGVVNDN